MTWNRVRGNLCSSPVRLFGEYGPKDIMNVKMFLQVSPNRLSCCCSWVTGLRVRKIWGQVSEDTDVDQDSPRCGGGCVLESGGSEKAVSQSRSDLSNE